MWYLRKIQQSDGYLFVAHDSFFPFQPDSSQTDTAFLPPMSVLWMVGAFFLLFYLTIVP